MSSSPAHSASAVTSSEHATSPALAHDVPRSEERVTYVRNCKSSGIPIEICYQCFGDPKAGHPVVLLVCGLNMQLYAWDETFCEDLVRAGFFVVRYDNRDIGHSTKVEQIGSVVGPRLLLPDKWASFFGERLPYSIESMARDGLALLDALGIARAHVFGISMGGAIAQTIAILAPHRIMSLTSLMSSTNGQDLPDPQMSVKLWMLRQPPKGCTIDALLDFRVQSLRHLLTHALPVDAAYLKSRYLMSLERSSYSAGLVRQAAALRRTESRDEALRKMTIPALVIHGAQDVVVPPIHGYRTALCLPHARLLVFKSMGHYFHPAFFPAIVTAFADMAATTHAVGGSPLNGTQLYHTLVPGFREPVRTPTTKAESGAPDRPFPSSSASSPVPGGSETMAVPAVSPTTASAAVSNTVAASLEGKLGLTNEDLMASIGPYLFPVVTSIYTKTGKAAISLVNTAIPIDGTIPVPEAVLLDLHEPAPSLSNPAVTSTRRPSAVGVAQRDGAGVTPEVGGVGRVQGVAVIATRRDPKPITRPAAAPDAPSTATPSSSPPTRAAVPVTPPPATSTSVSAPDGARAEVNTEAPPQSVTGKLSHWWGTVVAKATTTAPAAPTSTPSAPSSKDTAVTTSAVVSATTPGTQITRSAPPTTKTKTATSSLRDEIDVEDVVEPFVPGSPSIWNRAVFPPAMTTPQRADATGESAVAAQEEEQTCDHTGVPAIKPVRLVGIPLATHLQRLHEKEQRRRLQDQQQKEAERRLKRDSKDGGSRPMEARGARRTGSTFASPLAGAVAKGVVTAPGVAVVGGRPTKTAAAATEPLHGPTVSSFSFPVTQTNAQETDAKAGLQNAVYGRGEAPPLDEPTIVRADWQRDEEELYEGRYEEEEEEEEDVYTRAASTSDIAATLLAPVLPTETDDMVVSALPSPTERELETSRRRFTLTP